MLAEGAGLGADGGGAARFGAWLHRIVVNLCIDRRARAPLPLNEAPDQPDGAPHALDVRNRGSTRRVQVAVGGCRTVSARHWYFAITKA
jgi:DNA-directed RNA polymerase specialized sigma24 family protein